MKQFKSLLWATLILALLLVWAALPAFAASKPVISNFVMEEDGQTLYPGDSLHISVKVTSAAKIDSVTAVLMGAGSETITLYYSSAKDSYVGSKLFLTGDYEGVYAIRSITARDVNGNEDVLTTPAGSVKLTAATPCEGPVLSGFHMTNSGLSLAPGESVRFQVKAKPNNAAVSEICVTLEGPKTLTVFLHNTGSDNLWTGTYTFTTSDRNGSYTVTRVLAQDLDGCSSSILNPGFGFDFGNNLLKTIILNKQSAVLSITTEEASPAVQLKVVSYLPETASDPSVTWSSSDKTVAKVSQSGYVTAVGCGTCTITATANDGGKAEAVCKLTVTGEEVESITLSAEKKTLNITATAKHPRFKLKAKVLPKTAVNREVVWSSDDESVATVTQKGVVSARAAGSCVISCTAADGSGAYAECVITVKTKSGNEITLNKTGISLTRTSSKLNPSYRLTATVYPASAASTAVKWSSSDPSVAKVSGGTVTAYKEGSCYITCTLKSDQTVTAKCKVTVTNRKPTYITLSESSRTLVCTDADPEPSFTLTAKVTPSQAVVKTVYFVSSDEDVATVSKNGVVRAVGPGTCYISCFADGNSRLEATCVVRVK